MDTFTQSPINKVRRLPDRGAYDRKTIYEIIDAGLICHVGFVQDGQAFVIPTLHAREGERLIFHGAPASRMMEHIQSGEPICVTITLVDGLVLARSIFHHSINYRSAVLFGTGCLLTDREEKMAALKILSDKIVPGRWEDARQPNLKELNITQVVVMQIESASAKVRQGMPKDDDKDYALPVWAGVIPITQAFQAAQSDPLCATDIPLPSYLDELIHTASIAESRQPQANPDQQAAE